MSEKVMPAALQELELVVERGDGYVLGAAFVEPEDGEAPLGFYIWEVTDASIRAVCDWGARGVDSVTLCEIDTLARIEELPVPALFIESSVQIDERVLRLHPMVTLLDVEGPAIAQVEQLAPGSRLTSLACAWWNLPPDAPWLTYLTELHIWHVQERSLEWLAGFPSLVKLRLDDARRLESFEGVEHAPGLRSLSIAGATKVTDPTPLQRLPLLEELQLERAKRITSLEFVRSLPRLRVLGIQNAGPFDSARPLEALPMLEGLLAWDTTVFDDPDVSAIMKLPRLRSLRIMRRRHYVPQLSTFDR